jgi:phosphatidate cytidylyltransferase
MIRILSALAILPIVLGTVWCLPPIGTLVLASLVAGFAFVEYRALAARLGMTVPVLPGGIAVLATCITLGLGVGAVDVLLAALVAVGAIAVAGGRSSVLGDVAVTLFAPLYIGLPLGALAAVREAHGREALLALVLTIAVSDSAQFYAGRLFGRHALAATISPNKSVEGAVGGLGAGLLCFTVAGRIWLPGLDVWLLALVGVTLAALGIAGDLFESLLKRSADVKDSSGLIPGHGGMLDRLDSWLFAAPAYYVFLRYTL